MNRRKFVGEGVCAFVVAAAGWVALGASPYGNSRGPNYDKSKIAPYVLEDPLTFADGTKLTSPAEWPKRRAEILGIFAREMYGQPPPLPEAVVTEVADERKSCAGFAVRKLVKMWFRKDRTGPMINWIVWAPRHAKGPSPVILFLNYKGNFTLVEDRDIPPMTAWSRNRVHVKDHRVQESARGLYAGTEQDSIFPIGLLLAKGYAVMSACYCEVSPDPDPDWQEKNPAFRQDPFAYTGVFDLWPKRDPARDDNPTALGAWAWALSRGLDYAERDPMLDARRSIVTGYSRLGKAALLAGARDDRFAVCVPVQTGGGGCPLAKRDFGENPGTMNAMFTHWYCRAYRKYSDAPWKTMPFDQHLLLASIAPRALLVLGEGDSNWMNPEGEFLACRAAAPTWTFLGQETMPDMKDYPDNFDTSAVGGRLGFVRRSEGHGIAGHDWMWMLDFAEKAFKERGK